MTDVTAPASKGAQTDTMGAAAKTAADALTAAGLTWMDYADGINRGRLMRDLIDVHQVPEDDARAVVKGLGAALSEAARNLTVAAVQLQHVQGDLDNVLMYVNRARKGNGLPPLPAVKTGM